MSVTPRTLNLQEQIFQEKQENTQNSQDENHEEVSDFWYRANAIWRYLQKNLFFLQWELNDWFENFIYLLILASMVALTMDNPMADPNTNLTKNIRYLDRLITMSFATEALFRIIALGFYWSSLEDMKGYIKSPSNQVDFFVCIGCDVILLLNTSVFDTNLSQETLKSFKVLRSLRALRPLRIINRNEGLSLAVGSLFGAMPAIANGMIICFLVVFIYAIIGISLFKGQF